LHGYRTGGDPKLSQIAGVAEALDSLTIVITVLLWVKASVANLSEASVPKEVKNAEMDELSTYIGKKTRSTSSRP